MTDYGRAAGAAFAAGAEAGRERYEAAVERLHQRIDERKRELARIEAKLDAAGPWPRWRCRLGWHRQVYVLSGAVGTSYVMQFRCAGRCGAYWLSRDFRPPVRGDR